MATAIAADASFVARGASFRAKELTELVIAGMQNPGFSFIDAYSPCTSFNNTTQLWKDEVSQLDENHDPTDRAAAFGMALEDPMALGIFYKHEKPTMGQQLQALKDSAEATTADALLDGYALNVKIAG